jgi:hypothetical protein
MRLNKFVAALLLGLLASQAVAFAMYWRDQRFLASLMARIVSPSTLPTTQALQALAYLRDKPTETNGSYFLLPLFRPLRATPREVAELGGDCADRSRLMIVLLHSRGIPASKWALYSSDMQPRHAVVEADTEQGKMVLDPLFGLTYPRQQDGYYGIEDLRHNPSLFQDHITELRTRHERPGAEKLDWYPLNLYVYTYARTINWDKSGAMRLAYRTLRAVIGDRVNQIQRPIWAEQPALMFIIGVAGLEGGVLFIWGVAGWRQKRARKTALRTQQSGTASA